jgi:hypothetical protein
MDMKEFASLLSEAGEYAYAKHGEDILVRLEVTEYGFASRVSKRVADKFYHAGETVTFEEVFLAKFPVLKRAIDKAVTVAEALASRAA